MEPEGPSRMSQGNDPEIDDHEVQEKNGIATETDEDVKVKDQETNKKTFGFKLGGRAELPPNSAVYQRWSGHAKTPEV